MTLFLHRYHRPLSMLLHIALVVAANTLAFSLRFGGATPAAYWELWAETLPWLVASRVLLFIPFGLYEGMWRYTSLSDLRSVVFGVAASSAAFVLLQAVSGIAYPRSIVLIDAMILIGLMAGVRVFRMPRTGTVGRQRDRRVLIFGAGDAGAQIARLMKEDPHDGYRPVGFVDDDATKVGGRIDGVPILGTSGDMRGVLETCHPDQVVIAIPGASSTAVRALVRSVEPFSIPIKILPTLREMVDGRVDVKQIRSLAIEDLLARPAVDLDSRPLHLLLEGRRVLVTGAGGSIGSELCRQIAGLRPAMLVMVDRYENTLHAIRLELDDRKHSFGIVPIIADVTDDERINAVLAEHQPEIIFHAAAHKHVPLMEENPCEAVKNNVRGTRLLARAADAHGVDRFIMVSTDKAVNPTSVMGASKRLAELVVQAQAVGSGTSFSIVRFGNVLGSNGSVVPRFLAQIKHGGPVTVTHPDMRRFFMLIPEAVQLVLHAASQAENGATYVLEMGEQVKLVDLVRDMIRLSGGSEEGIKIEFTGLRPGEKLYEELVGVEEEARSSAVQKILCVRPKCRPAARFFAEIAVLESAAAAGHDAIVIETMRTLIGTFRRADDSPLATAERPPVLDVPAIHVQSHDEQPCPQCGTGQVHRSRVRTRPERDTKDFTVARLFRCDECGWRGWLDPAAGTDAAVILPSNPDLRSVDAVISRRPATRHPSFSPRNLH